LALLHFEGLFYHLKRFRASESPREIWREKKRKKGKKKVAKMRKSNENEQLAAPVVGKKSRTHLSTFITMWLLFRGKILKK
jgi:hypothetical protein